MARIADEEIERLKREVDLVELVTRSGVALKKVGGDLVGGARSTTTTPRAWSSRPGKASGTAWGPARRAGR